MADCGVVAVELFELEEEDPEEEGKRCADRTLTDQAGILA